MLKMLSSVHTKLEKALLLGMLGNLVHDLVSMSKTSKAFTAYLDCLPPGIQKGILRKVTCIIHLPKAKCGFGDVLARRGMGIVEKAKAGTGPLLKDNPCR